MGNGFSFFFSSLLCAFFLKKKQEKPKNKKPELASRGEEGGGKGKGDLGKPGLGMRRKKGWDGMGGGYDARSLRTKGVGKGKMWVRKRWMGVVAWRPRVILVRLS